MIKIGGSNALKTGIPGSRLILAQSVAGKPKEVHPIGGQGLDSTTFTTPQSLGILPYSYMVGPSAMYPAVVQSNRFGSQFSVGWYTNFRFAQRQYNGNVLTLEAVVADIQPVARESCLILSSDAAAVKRVELVFGSDGSRIRAMTNATVDFQIPFTHTISNGNKITVMRMLDYVAVYINDVFVYSGRNELFKPSADKYFVGLSVWADENFTSTDFTSFKAEGSTTFSASVLGRLDITRAGLPVNTKTLVGELYMATGGPATVMLAGTSWTTGATFSTRKFYANVNGTEVAVVEGNNGGNASANVTLPANSLIQVYASANSVGESDRVIKTGRLEIYPV